MRRTRRLLVLVAVAGSVVAVGGCLLPELAWPPRPAEPPPSVTPAPPPPPGALVAGFWSTWSRPLRQCLAKHRKRQDGQCRGKLGLVVHKGIRRMAVTCDGEPVKGYVVALGSSPVGDKERRGDGRTPEGEYYVYGKNARSRYYLAFQVSYPNPADAERGAARGLIPPDTRRRISLASRSRSKPPQDTRLGGDICIHGGGIGEVIRQEGRKYVRVRDWTEGCVALRDEDVRELFAAIPAGAPVRILP